MRLIHFKRGILWIGELIYTLFKFWLNHPQESPAILKFIAEKIIASPKFFSRNILIEKHSRDFKKTLLQTVKSYEKYGKYFNPKDVTSYKKLEDKLSGKTQILYFLIRKIKPGIVVETGVSSGESTGFILQGLYDNKKGKLYSIDLPFQWYIYGSHTLHLDSLPAGKKPGFLIPTKLKNRWKLILGNTHEKLPLILKDLGSINMFFHDSEHSDKTMMFEYKTAWPYIKKGGFLLSDDVSYTKAFNSFSKAKKVKYIVFKDLGVINKNG